MNEINIKPFEILNNWQQHLNEANLSGIMKLYDEKCVLIPTFSSEILTDHIKIKEYFVEVIEIQKGKVKFQPNSFSEQKVGDNIYLLSGKYFFHFMEKRDILQDSLF